jgi:hypothetical protein
MRRKTYVLWKKILTRICVLALVVGAGYLYFHTGVFTIHSYAVTGVPKGYEDTIQAGLKKIQEKKLYWVLPGNRTISFHYKAIESFIRETLPNTKSISVRPSGLHTMRISITSYTPVFRLSQGKAVADDGTVYQEISRHEDLPELSLATSTQISGAQIRQLEKLITDISAVLFPIRSVSADEYGDIRFFNETKSSSVVANLDLDMTKVWSNVLSAIDTEPLKSKLANQNQNLFYLDVRFGNKVFYKFTNGQETAIIPPHGTSTESTTTVQ